MADIQQFLSKKAGPLPVWGWAAAGGGLLTVLYLRGKGQAQAPAGAQGVDTSGTGPFAPSPIIVTPNTMPDGTSSANPPPQPAPSSMVTLQGSHGVVWVWSQPGRTGLLASLPNGTALQSAGPPVQGQSFSEGSLSSNMWVPVKYIGATGYVWAPEAQAGSGGMGGASTSVKTLPGAGRIGRFTSPHAHKQFLNVSGMGGGPYALKAVAGRTGIPEIRLMALNPGHWRPTPGGRPRHIQIA